MSYLTIKEVSQRLRLHRVTVGNMVKRGELVAIKGNGPNGRVKIDEKSVQAYIAARSVQASS